MSRNMLRSALVLALLGVVASFIGSSQLRATGNLEVGFTGPNEVYNRLWPNAAIPITWFFNVPVAGNPCFYSASDAPPASLQAAVQAGFDAWENDPYSRIDFTYGGTTVNRDARLDGEPIVTFCDPQILASDPGFLASTPSTAWTGPGNLVVVDDGAGGPDGCPAGKGLIDTNGPPPGGEFCFPAGSYPEGTMVDADVQYNVFGANEEDFWSTNGTIAKFEVQDTATHENGHFFGLSHNPALDATMFPFIDDNPRSDGLGQAVPKMSDLSTSALYYPEAGFATDFGTITGKVTLNGQPGDGVHVMAIDPQTLLPVGSRFSISRFENPSSLGPEGPDFNSFGGGFYRIQGLTPQNYYVCVEYFNDSEFISGRLQNRYNTTVDFSNVQQGATTPGSLGFRPQLAECFNNEIAGDPASLDSGNGGNGSFPGVSADNSDAATLVSVTAGSVTSGVDIAINIEPSGPTPASRENPTTRETFVNTDFTSGDVITAFLLDGGTDDFWMVRFPSASLPPPPYNVAEGLWSRAGLVLSPMVTMLTGPDPGNPNIPDLSNPIVSSAGRMVAGGPGGVLASGDFADVRDQWNVTINSAQDLWVVVNQPEAPPGISFLTEGYFPLVTCTPACAGSRVGRTLVTEDGGVSIFLTIVDLFYDVITELHPPVMITGATSIAEGAIQTISISGFGFKPGATVDLGPDVIVHDVTYVSGMQLDVLAQVPCTGAVSPRLEEVVVTNPEVLFPNVSRVLTINPKPAGDTDCDGTLDGADCDPLDPGAFTAAGLVSNVELTHAGGNQVDISFDNQGLSAGAGTVYDVITGLASGLFVDRDFSGATCGVNDFSPGYSFAPVIWSHTAADPVGTIRYFLPRATNTCNAPAGSYGDSESTIVPDPRDALDAGVPCSN